MKIKIIVLEEIKPFYNKDGLKTYPAQHGYYIKLIDGKLYKVSTI